VKLFADDALCFAYRVAEAIDGNSFEDHTRRVGFIFPGGYREFVETLAALKYLQYPKAILTSPFLDSEFRATLRACGPWL